MKSEIDYETRLKLISILYNGANRSEILVEEYRRFFHIFLIFFFLSETKKRQNNILITLITLNNILHLENYI